MKRRQTGRAFIMRKMGKMLLEGGLLLAALLALLTSGFASGEEVALFVSFKGLKLNAMMQWQTVPLNGTFEVLAGDTVLGEITANRTQEQRDMGIPESLNVNRQDAARGLSLRPVTDSLPAAYVCQDVIAVAWNEESSIRADVFAYAREGLFSLTNTQDGQPLGSASYSVINESGQTVLSFETDQEGRYSPRTLLPEGRYTLHQALAPEGMLPAEDISFDIAPYIGVENSAASLTVENFPVPSFSRLKDEPEMETVPAQNQYAGNQTAEFHVSNKNSIGNTIPLQNYSVEVGGLALWGPDGNLHPDQSGTEIKSISIVAGTKGIRAKAYVFDDQGRQVGEELQLAPGQSLSLNGWHIASVKILYIADNGQQEVPEQFIPGEISLTVGLNRRMPAADTAGVSQIGITFNQKWQYSYPGRDRNPVTAYGESGSRDLRARVLDGRAAVTVSAVTKGKNSLALTIRHEGGPAIDSPRLAVKLPDGWRVQKDGLAAPVAAVSHGELADIVLLSFSGQLTAGQAQTVELSAATGAGDGEGAVWIESKPGVSPSLDNPDGLMVWGERLEGCPVADAALGLSKPGMYAYSTWKAKNETGLPMSLQPAGFPSDSGGTSLPESGNALLLFQAGDVSSISHIIKLPDGIRLSGKPQGQVFVTTDLNPQPVSVWEDADAFTGDWTQVTALSLKADTSSLLPVQVSARAGTVRVQTLIQTPQWSGESAYLADEEGTLSLNVGRTAAITGRMFDDANQNGRQDDGENGAGGQLVLWYGSGGESYYAYTDAQGLFDFSGAQAKDQAGNLFAQLPENTAIAGPLGGNGLFLAAQTGLNKKSDVQIAFSRMSALYGRVYDQESQEGAAGVEVTLNKGGNAVGYVMTDNGGQYRFDALTAGEHQLTLKLPEALSSQAGFFPGDGYAKTDGLIASLPPVTLAYGGEASQDAPVRKYGTLDVSIQGYTYPLGSAALYQDGALVAESSAADDSAYHFGKLFSGSYTLALQIPQGLAIRAEGMQAWQKGAVSLDVSVPSADKKQLVLEETVTGTLLLQFTGAGLADAPVMLSGPEERQGVLDAKGSCALADLLPGLYQVRVLLPDTVLEDQAGIWQVEKGQGNTAMSLSVEVFPGQEAAPQAAQLLQTASVSGIVFEDGNRNALQDSGEAPLSGAQVSLFTQKDGTWSQVQTTQTGPDGMYSFGHLIPGQYSLSILLPSGKALSDLNVQEQFLLESGKAYQRGIGAVSPAAVKATAFWDSNNDGIRGIYERAIEGTLVEILPAEDSTDTIVVKAVTDKDGQAYFEGVTPGEYILRFTLPEGYWLASQIVGSGENQNAVPATDSRQGTTEPFVLAEGQTAGFGVGGVKTGYISGRVWLDSNEDGIMNDGEPGLSGCEITLTGERNGQRYTYTTDESGLYEITARIDTYQFSIKGPEGMSFTRPSTVGGLNRSIITTEGVGAGEREYALESGTREENLNIGYVPGVILEGVAFLDANYNGLKDDGEELLSGVILELTKSNLAKELGSVVTGQDGSFRFDSLRGGDYDLRAVLPDRNVVFTRVPEGDADYRNEFVQRPGRRESTVTLSLSSGERYTLGVGAVVPGGISGSVFEDQNYNGLYDGGEKPVSGILVRLLDQDGETVASVKTNASGQYAFGSLMPMTYTLAIEKQEGSMFTKLVDGQARSRVQSAVENEGFTDAIPVALGEQVGSVYAGIIPPAKVLGQVFADANDDGLLTQGESGFEGALVSLLSESGETVQSVVTGADGLFAFADLHPGRYIISYLIPEDAVYSLRTAGGSEITGDGIAASGEAFELKIGETKRVPLCGALVLGRISGSSFHDANANGAREETEETLSGVRLTLVSRLTGLEAGSAVTGDDGSFLLDRLRPGAYTLNVSLPSGMVFTRSGAGILMAPVLEQQSGMDIELGMGEKQDGRLIGAALPGSLQGQLWLDENDNGLYEPGEALLGHLNVDVLDTLTGDIFATLETDENGSYLVPVIWPGVYSLTVHLPNNSIATDMSAGDNMFADGAPGTMVLTGLALTEEEAVTGIQGGVRQYTSIAGKVWADEQGTAAPLMGTQVSLYKNSDLQTPIQTVVTGEDGTYLFTKLMPGECRISAVLPQGYLFVKPNDARLHSGEAVSIITDIAAGWGDAFQLKMGQDQAGLDIGAVQTGMLGDFAWLDENGNGLQDAGEPGIPGLNVALIQDGQQAAEAVTDEYGYYLFDNVYPMLSQVQVTMYAELTPATQRTDYPVLVSALAGYQGTVANTGEVMVTSGGRNFDCDLGFVLKEGSKRPDAILPPPEQKWD